MDIILNDPMLKLFFQQLFIIIIGLLAALYFYFGLRKKYFGNFWVTLALGFTGAAIGSYLLNKIFRILVNWPFGINTLATLFGAFFLVWVYTKISVGKQ